MQSPRYRTFEIQLCSMGNPIYKAIQNIFSNFQSQHKYFAIEVLYDRKSLL